MRSFDHLPVVGFVGDVSSYRPIINFSNPLLYISPEMNVIPVLRFIVDQFTLWPNNIKVI